MGKNKKVEIIQIDESNIATLNQLYDDSSLTIEGLAPDDIEAFVDFVDEAASLKKRRAYIISGKTMNKAYRLHDENKYPEDLNIVAIMLADMKNPSAVAIPRFSIGGRWYDDIVDNNAIREKRGVKKVA